MTDTDRSRHLENSDAVPADGGGDEQGSGRLVAAEGPDVEVSSDSPAPVDAAERADGSHE